MLYDYMAKPIHLIAQSTIKIACDALTRVQEREERRDI